MGSGASTLEGMSPEEVVQMEVAYSKAKEDGLEGLDLIQVTPYILLLGCSGRTLAKYTPFFSPPPIALHVF